MAYLRDISEASQDADLRDRLYSAAAEAGIEQPEAWVLQNARQLAAAPIAAGNTTDTIASVYAYAAASRQPPPGANPSAVTDDYLRHAVQAVNAS